MRREPKIREETLIAGWVGTNSRVQPFLPLSKLFLLPSHWSLLVSSHFPDWPPVGGRQNRSAWKEFTRELAPDWQTNRQMIFMLAHFSRKGIITLFIVIIELKGSVVVWEGSRPPAIRAFKQTINSNDDEALSQRWWWGRNEKERLLLGIAQITPTPCPLVLALFCEYIGG